MSQSYLWKEPTEECFLLNQLSVRSQVELQQHKPLREEWSY